MKRRYPFADHVVHVPVPRAAYDVVVGQRLLSHVAPTLRSLGLPETLVILTDRRVAGLYLDPLVRHLRRHAFTVLPIIIPSGERQKSLSSAERIFSTMLSNGIGRQATVLAFGGGVVGDLGGFVAATYQRGIPLVHIPTTLLAQVDSSIGGKVAVNHPLGKNMVGAFYQPRLVWADVSYLRSLPQRELVCGLGEVVKYGIIRDPRLFSWLRENLPRVIRKENRSLLHVQARCAAIKASVCGRDERETGVRIILNYGHTVGHAIEAAGGYSSIKHGEAVLLGMKAEAWLAKRLGIMSDRTYGRIASLIEAIPLRGLPTNIRMAAVMNSMQLDKKNRKGRKRFVLPRRIGSVVVVEGGDDGIVRESVRMVL